MRFAIALATAIASLGWLTSPAQALSSNHAAALRWQGWVSTNLKFSEFFGTDHTLMVRFMPQWIRAYAGPIVGATVGTGGGFSLGQGDYDENPEGPKLELQISGKRWIYPAPGLTPGKWQHLAVRRVDNTFMVYLNGEQLCSPGGLFCALDQGTPAIPGGRVLLGRTTTSTGSTLPAEKQQFYGLLDDVAVFDWALESDQIKYIATNRPRLTGSEAGLHAGYLFESHTPSGDPLPSKLLRPMIYKGDAYRAKVSKFRNEKSDRLRLPVPAARFRMRLPFIKGAAYRIVQGYSETTSHGGSSAFSIDASRMAGATGTKIYASTEGMIDRVEDTFDELQDPNCKKGEKFSNCNLLRIQRAPGIVVSYRHLRKGSIAEAFGGQAPTVGTPVSIRRWIGRVGDHPNGAHLHFSVNTNPTSDTSPSTSVPAVFKNYEVCGLPGPMGCLASIAWTPVPYGVPITGQIVRVP